MSKLLIVDDEIDIREFAKNFFKKRGIDVFTASGGSEAAEIVGAERPDLILLDVRMEEMTGVEFLRQLREGGDQTHVIMVSGSPFAARSRSSGIVSFFALLIWPPFLCRAPRAPTGSAFSSRAAA